MNAPFDSPTFSGDAFRNAIDDANRWRGRIVNLFARGELVVAKALQSDKAKPLPMVLSQRIARLNSEIEDSPKRLAAVSNFVALTRDRNAIVHGSGRVYLGRDGFWLLTLETIDKSGTHKRAISQADAEAQDRELKVAVDQLAAAFRP